MSTVKELYIWNTIQIALVLNIYFPFPLKFINLLTKVRRTKKKYLLIGQTDAMVLKGLNEGTDKN